jgi:hypothetical protein
MNPLITAMSRTIKMATTTFVGPVIARNTSSPRVTRQLEQPAVVGQACSRIRANARR